ncbi:hypothetical protein HDU76_013377 [Blyttiomyces sp. JEL0837]|nr:hypothetical protein HDU76_013377 [Blyttiomyces sp. JEL0837]
MSSLTPLQPSILSLPISRMNAISSLLLILLASTTTISAATTTSTTNCTVDDDCRYLNSGLGDTHGNAGYVCSPLGEICQRASDCAQYQYVQRQLNKNITADIILGQPGINITTYLEGLCSPSFCTISSFCTDSNFDLLNSSSNPFDLPEYPSHDACCAGGSTSMTCSSIAGGSLNTCDLDNTCQNFTCAPINKKATQWIGILISLIGAAFLNVGLNLQKLALRKRHETTQKKKMQLRMMQRLSAIRLGALRFPSFSAKKRSPSINSRSSFMGSTNGDGGVVRFWGNRRVSEMSESTVTHEDRDDRESVDHGQEATGSHQHHHQQATIVSGLRNSKGRNHLDLGIELPRSNGGLKVTTEGPSSATVTREDGTTETITLPVAPEDKAEFQKNLNFSSLIKNPIWILGFLIFIFSNFFNFVALQFAPQSLIAPLGSISLVVNVILAPIINREKFTWKDVIGVILIVGGSSMTIVFAGVSGKDYKLCVLLALFRRPATIGFLTVTGALVVFVFLLLCFIEKNIDLKPNDANTNGAIGNEASDESIELTHQPGQTAIIVELPANRDSVLQWTSAMTTKVYSLQNIARRASNAIRGRSASNSPMPGATAGGDEVSSNNGADSVEEEQQSSNGKEHNLFAAGPANNEKVVSTGGRGSLEEIPSQVMITDKNGVPVKTFNHPHGHTTSSTSSSSFLVSSSAGAGGVEGAMASRESLDTVVADRSPTHHHPPTTIPSLKVITEDDVPVIALDEDGNIIAKEVTLPESAVTKITSPTSTSSNKNGKSSDIAAPARPPRAGLGGNGGDSPRRPKTDPALLQAPDERLLVVAATTVVNSSSGVDAVSEGVIVEEDENSKTPLVKPTMAQRLYKYSPQFVKDVIAWWNRIDILPRLKNKIPLNSKAVTVVLPLAYATLGGLMATITVLFAKSTVHLLSDSLFQGDNQFNNIFAWIIFGVTVVTAVSQIYWINMGLQRYDALLQIPVFYVVWTVFDVVGGGIYFNEFDGFTTRQYSLFVLAIAIIFMGVAILADRLKKAEGL